MIIHTTVYIYPDTTKLYKKYLINLSFARGSIYPSTEGQLHHQISLTQITNHPTKKEYPGSLITNLCTLQCINDVIMRVPAAVFMLHSGHFRERFTCQIYSQSPIMHFLHTLGPCRCTENVLPRLIALTSAPICRCSLMAESLK